MSVYKSKLFSLLFIVVLALFVSNEGFGIGIKYESVNPSGTVTINTNGSSAHVYAGVYNISVDWTEQGDIESVAGFCVETTEAAPQNWHYGYSQYSIEDMTLHASETTGDLRRNFDKAAWLADQYFSGEHTNAVATQIAIWEVLYDDDFDLDTGTFTASYYNGTDPIPDAASYLQNVGSLTTGYVVLHNGAQDYITPVPEPATLVLLCAGLFGFIVTRRRKKQ